MNTQPLLFLGERRRNALQSRAASALARWRSGWVPGLQDAFEVSCEPPDVAGFTAPVASVATSGWSLCVGDERMAVLLLPHATFSWCVHASGGQPFDGGAAVAPDSIGEQLELEVARSLLLETCVPDKREVTKVSRFSLGDLADWSRTARAWKLQARYATGRNLTLLVSAARLEVLLPARAPGRQPLQSAREAIGENTVSLRAVVGETHIPVGELAGLAIDDVLVLDQVLTDPVTIISDRSQSTVVAGNLGRAGARRAIKITGAAAPRN